MPDPFMGKSKVLHTLVSQALGIEPWTRGEWGYVSGSGPGCFGQRCRLGSRLRGKNQGRAGVPVTHAFETIAMQDAAFGL